MIVLDTETTGVDRGARIIELAICGDVTHSWRFNPGIPIPAEATAIHGITDADVADCATFAQLAPDAMAHIRAATVIAGFQLRFDLDMIQSELDRAGLPLLDLSRVALIDARLLWAYHEPHTLAAAHEKFCGAPIVNAHSAMADVRATDAVLASMVERFGLTGQTWSDIAALCDPLKERHQYAGPTGHMLWRDGVVVWGVGKHKDTPLHETPRDYLRWVGDADFPEHVKRACRAAAEYPPDLFLSRCRWHFGREVA